MLRVESISRVRREWRQVSNLPPRSAPFKMTQPESIMNRRFQCLATFLCLLATGGAVRADEVDDLVGSLMKEQHMPGSSVAVVKDGKVFKAQGYGLANVGHTVPAKAETVYQSGSVGK